MTSRISIADALSGVKLIGQIGSFMFISLRARYQTKYDHVSALDDVTGLGRFTHWIAA